MHHLLLVADPLVVSILVGMPLPGKGQSTFPLEMVPAGFHAFGAIGVERIHFQPFGDLHIDAAHGIHEIHQTGEVDPDGIVDFDAQVVLNGAFCGAHTIQTGVRQLVIHRGAGCFVLLAGHGQVGIPGNAGDQHDLCAGIDRQQHVHIRPGVFVEASIGVIAADEDREGIPGDISHAVRIIGG